MTVTYNPTDLCPNERHAPLPPPLVPASSLEKYSFQIVLEFEKQLVASWSGAIGPDSDSVVAGLEQAKVDASLEWHGPTDDGVLLIKMKELMKSIPVNKYNEFYWNGADADRLELKASSFVMKMYATRVEDGHKILMHSTVSSSLQRGEYPAGGGPNPAAMAVVFEGEGDSSLRLKTTATFYLDLDQPDSSGVDFDFQWLRSGKNLMLIELSTVLAKAMVV